VDFSHILVTFQGIIDGFERPRLGLLDISTSTFRVVRHPPDIIPAEEGLGGAALSERYLFVASPRFSMRSVEPIPKSDLLIFDRRDLKLVNQYRCRSVSDAHSIVFRDDHLLVASTGTDELIELTLCGPDVVDERTI